MQQQPVGNKCLVDFEDKKLGLTEGTTIVWFRFKDLQKIIKVIEIIANCEENESGIEVTNVT